MSTDDTKPTTGTSIPEATAGGTRQPPHHLHGARSRHGAGGRSDGIVRRSAGRVVPGSRTRTVLRWLVREQPDLSAGRGVGADPPRVGSTHPRSVRTTTPYRGGGRGSGPAGGVGGAGGTGAGAAASPTDGLDHRAARARPHRRCTAAVADRRPARARRRAGGRALRPDAGFSPRSTPRCRRWRGASGWSTRSGGRYSSLSPSWVWSGCGRSAAAPGRCRAGPPRNTPGWTRQW